MHLTRFPNGIEADIVGILTGGVIIAIQVITEDGPIDVQAGAVMLDKPTPVLATIRAPLPDENGITMYIASCCKKKHEICAVDGGFDDGGVNNDTAVFDGTIGDGMVMVAYNGMWIVRQLKNVKIKAS